MIDTGDPVSNEQSGNNSETTEKKESTPAFLTDSPAPEQELQSQQEQEQEQVQVQVPEQEQQGQQEQEQEQEQGQEQEAEVETAPPVKRKRLPQDVVGKLEDKLGANPYDAKAWRGLIEEYTRQEKLDEVRSTYERMLKYFPTSSETWCGYIELETANGEFQRVEQLFGRCLKQVPNVNLWSLYLAYIRRRNDTKSGDEAMINTVEKAFEFVLDGIGIDKDSGPVWTQYIDFIKQKKTNTTWEEQQKMDLLRKTYRRALVIPLKNVEAIWQSYNAFEQNLNKTTARKFVAEKSAGYMTARSSMKEMQHMIDGIDRFNTTPKRRKWNAAEQHRAAQWKKWIAWEKKNPLEAGSDVVASRTWYAYQQAVMAMRYFPEFWFEAAEYAFDNGNDTDGKVMLANGFDANPLSFLLAFKKAEVEESRADVDSMQATYSKLIQNLQKKRETIPKKHLEDLETNACDITTAYITKMKAVNRSLGVRASRQVFSECRKSPTCTFHIFVAAAKMECYNNKEQQIGTKIFELGLKKYGDQARFVKEYFDFLISNNDDVNARALFEKSVTKMNADEARPLYEHFLKYEANYGELAALLKLEKRYKDLYANVDSVELFAARNKFFDHDPIQQLDFGQRFKKTTPKDVEVDEDEDDDEPPLKRAKEDAGAVYMGQIGGGVPLPQGIVSLLNALPPRETYDTVIFDTAKIIKVIQDVELPVE